jgi:hypothetical protein
MSEVIEVKIPDIGDFKNIPVIEVLVKPGDSVSKEDPLISLESDKATMEVPSPGGRRGEGAQGQGRRQGFGRHGGAHARCDRRRERAARGKQAGADQRESSTKGRSRPIRGSFRRSLRPR